MTLGRAAAATTLVGLVASGPLAVALVAAIAPQPPWQDAALFARSFHLLQLLPYVFGFALVTGLLLLIISLGRPVAIAFATVFATLVFLNYVLQTTVVPALVRTHRAGDDAIITLLSMSNPSSLGWALEMWGYAFLGVATALSAPALWPISRAAAIAFAANGVISVAGAVATAASPGWVQTRAGLAGYTAWNLLVAVMAILSWRATRAYTDRSRTSDHCSTPVAHYRRPRRGANAR